MSDTGTGEAHHRGDELMLIGSQWTRASSWAVYIHIHRGIGGIGSIRHRPQARTEDTAVKNLFVGRRPGAPKLVPGQGGRAVRGWRPDRRQGLQGLLPGQDRVVRFFGADHRGCGQGKGLQGFLPGV